MQRFKDPTKVMVAVDVDCGNEVESKAVWMTPQLPERALNRKVKRERENTTT